MPSAPTCSTRRLPALLALGVAAGLGGCGFSTNLRIQDDAATTGNVRVIKRLGSGAPGIELDAASVSGSGRQTLAGFDIVSAGTQSIGGPAVLRQEARVQYVQLAYNHRLFAGRPFEMEWFAGVAQVRVNWTARTEAAPVQTLRAKDSWSGPAGGLLLRAQLAGPVSLEARYAGAARLFGQADGGIRQHTELALALRPAGPLVLRAGWADSRHGVRPEPADSELILRTRGPFASLGLEF